MNAINIKFLTLFGLFSAIIVFGALFLSGNWFQSVHAKTDVATLTSSGSAIEVETEVPVIQLASLSINTGDNGDAISNEEINFDTDTESLLIRAKSYVQEQKFDEAIHVLDSVQDTHKDDYAVRFLQAKVLSWSGKHYEADQKFRILSKDFPENSDILVSYGYLKLYQKKYTDAEHLFGQVLKKHPEYMDAIDGLSTAQMANRLSTAE